VISTVEKPPKNGFVCSYSPKLEIGDMFPKLETETYVKPD
jgi:hypothetical protein